MFNEWSSVIENIISSKYVSKRTQQQQYELGSGRRTATCQFPKVNTYEPSVMAIAGLNLTTITCEGFDLPDLAYIEGTRVVVNKSKVDEHALRDKFKHCKYRHIWRNQTNDGYTYSDWSESFTDKIELPKNSEFLNVQCWDKQSKLVSNKYFYLVPRKKEFDDFDAMNFEKRKFESAPKETLNVVMVMLDSLPRNQFIRACNKTYSYLIDTLKSFDLSMHSQLAKRTFPNIVGLFTDHLEDETRKWWGSPKVMDTFDLIWPIFEKAGYCTMFTESSSSWGVFHIRGKSFDHPFVRYYARPIDLAIYDDDSIKRHTHFCAGNQLEFNMRLDYAVRLLDTFPDKPVFAVVVNCGETHTNQANVKRFDEHFYNFYKLMREKGHLNNTLVIAFSDHGATYGAFRNSVNGHFELLTPYTILTFPEWFLKKYPDVAENLRTNTKRLTSHFDTRATLLDLLYFKSDNPPPLAPIRHGMSLFKEIPWNRTCVDASIPPEFCLCGYKDVREVDVNSEFSKKISLHFIKRMNNRLPEECAEHVLKQILRVTQITYEGENLKANKGLSFYRVKIQTTPGDGIFEARMHADKNADDCRFGQNIFRLNAYKGQSDCISSPFDKHYCYCKNLLH
ncbi:hypothetical protein BsWGS_24902 [Bradybaena similaris]